uniref:Uncharacterized protein n=1 Tax=Daucus carota subsp. sativus TaxID=79200 RepID=A0A165A3H1_DAUCS
MIIQPTMVVRDYDDPHSPQYVWPALELHGPSEGLVSQVIKGKQTLKGGKGNNKNKLPPPTNYTGPSLHGCSTEAPVQLFKTHVGGTELVSATFTKNGSYVYTQGALTKALAAAKRKVGEGNSIASQLDDTMHKDGTGDEAGGEDAT